MDPYAGPRPHCEVALLTAEGHAVDRHGAIVDLGEWPKRTILYAAFDTVQTLIEQGHGEALCWNTEAIRWRHTKQEEDGWTRRPSDANVLRLRFPQHPEQTLRGLETWRDWLESYGASPTGTTGAAAMSLLKARLERRLITSTGDRPPVRWTTGGRQQLGPGWKGSYRGRLAQVDLPAAYAAELGNLPYGGVWHRCALNEAEHWAGEFAVYAHATVYVPARLTFGPLPQRPRVRPRDYMDSALLGATYPTGRRLAGTWTWQELAAAEQAGCTVTRDQAWVHRSAWRPFAPWWAAVQEGRALGGFPALLAKVTGNALWGRFAMDPRGQRGLTIRSRNGRLRSRPVAPRLFPWPAHDLAETVAGRVRARLFLLMHQQGSNLLSAHTDGAWVRMVSAEVAQGRRAPVLTGVVAGSSAPALGWRVKQHARRLDLLDPQVLRYWPDPPRPTEPWTVYAGVPAERADRAFDQAWAAYLAE